MAGLLEHTSLTKDDILMLSIAEIEGILDGMQRNNAIDGRGSREEKKVLEGHEGLRFLIDQKGVL